MMISFRTNHEPAEPLDYGGMMHRHQIKGNVNYQPTMWSEPPSRVERQFRGPQAQSFRDLDDDFENFEGLWESLWTMNRRAADA